MSRRCVLVGLGYWGRIISGYLKEAGFDPVSVYDRKTGIAFERFLELQKPEAVFVCSPVSAHYEYVKASLESGCDVFCEKMLTADPEQASKLHALADYNGKVLFTDYIYLYSPSVRKMRELLGTIGKVRRIEGKITQYGKFYGDVDVCGNIGVHMISAAGFLTGFAPVFNVSVSDTVLREGDLCECRIGFDSCGTEIDITASLIRENKERTIIVTGDGGTLTFDMNENKTLTTPSEKYAFDEHNNLINSIAAFAACTEHPGDPEYALNRTCCNFTEEIVDLLYKKYKK